MFHDQSEGLPRTGYLIPAHGCLGGGMGGRGSSPVAAAAAAVMTPRGEGLKLMKTDKYDNIQRWHVPKIPGTPFLRGKTNAPAGAPKTAKSL